MKFTDSHNVVLVANVMTLKTQAMAMMAAVALCAASAQAAVSVLGDANLDERVDAKDASLVLSFYAFLSTGGSGSMEDWLATQAG